MKLAYLASAFFTSTDPISFLLDSAGTFNIVLRLYGFGTLHHGFIAVKVTALLPELERLHSLGYTHVLYTDGPDTFFVKGHTDITTAYKSLGSPPWLISAETHAYPHTHLVIPESQRYPCTGQYMGEIGAIIDSWAGLRMLYGDTGDNEQGWVLRGMAEGHLPESRCMIDTGRKVFRSEADSWQPGDPGCLLHFNGGYYDPQVGRKPRMQPVWDKVFPC